ncbi:hypothetical protein V1478_006032 [Vespula squamosa]|uniref:Uncharacterized protein n=1 Tax=Vespula squamosa TaxID=30214 RepID=A0ABD2B9M1_VESSQ
MSRTPWKAEFNPDANYSAPANVVLVRTRRGRDIQEINAVINRFIQMVSRAEPIKKKKEKLKRIEKSKKEKKKINNKSKIINKKKRYNHRLREGCVLCALAKPQDPPRQPQRQGIERRNFIHFIKG